LYFSFFLNPGLDWNCTWTCKWKKHKIVSSLMIFSEQFLLKNGNKNQYCDIIQERLFWTRFCSVTRSFCLSYISVFNYTPWYLGLLHISGRPRPPATPTIPTHSIISNRYWWLEKNKEIQPNPPPGDFNLTLVLIFYYYKWKPRELSGAITKFPREVICS